MAWVAATGREPEPRVGSLSATRGARVSPLVGHVSSLSRSYGTRPVQKKAGCKNMHSRSSGLSLLNISSARVTDSERSRKGVWPSADLQPNIRPLRRGSACTAESLAFVLLPPAPLLSLRLPLRCKERGHALQTARGIRTWSSSRRLRHHCLLHLNKF